MSNNASGEEIPARSNAQSLSPPIPTREASTSRNAARVRRRNRVIASCLECRRRKLKCDKTAPCTNCSRASRDCVYLAPALDSASQRRLAELKDRMGSLEQSLEQNVARHGTTDPALPQAVKVEDGSDLEDDDVDEPEDERNLEPTRLAVLDQVYDDDADDDLMDLGVQLGKLRVSDRVGGFARPKFAEEVCFTYLLLLPLTNLY